MTTPQKAIAYAVLAIVLVLGTAWGIKYHAASKGSKAEVLAQVFKGEANAANSQAAATDTQVQAVKKANAPLQADVDSARAEVQRLRKLLAARPQPVPNPPGSDPSNVQPVAAPDLNMQLDSAKDELIAKQDTQIQGLKTENALQATEIGQLKVALDLRDKQAMAQEAATAAWKQAVVASKIEGRIEGGGAVGAIWAITKLVGHL